MSEIFLHQYDSSPFSEKVRIAFGIKALAWRAVDQPVVMPKPELTCLTGGYRRIPVMQIGADIYCDSQLILRELERRFPEPTLIPDGSYGLMPAVGFWSDRVVFQAAVGVIFGGIGEQVDASFKKDREALMGRRFDTAAMREAAPLMRDQLRAHGAFLEEQLADGRRFLTGDRPGLADIHGWYNLWFVRSFYPAGADVFDPMARLVAWEERMRAVGHGHREEALREDAIVVARETAPQSEPWADAHEANALEPGDAVRVMAEDYGRDPIEGRLVSSSAHHVAIARTDARAGEVVVHFPRAGFWVMPATA